MFLLLSTIDRNQIFIHFKTLLFLLKFQRASNCSLMHIYIYIRTMFQTKLFHLWGEKRKKKNISRIYVREIYELYICIISKILEIIFYSRGKERIERKSNRSKQFLSYRNKSPKIIFSHLTSNYIVTWPCRRKKSALLG